MQVNICWQHFLGRFTRLLVSHVSKHEYINMVHLHKHATQKKWQSPKAEYVMQNCYMNMRSSGIY